VIGLLDSGPERRANEKFEVIRALLAHLTAVVATSPLTDDEDKRELMKLWYAANDRILNED
jgi:hypothetical protein